MKAEPPTLIITPRGPIGAMRWRELWAARDLCGFLVWRDWKARYVQSVLGIGWAILPPLFSMGVFTVVFGKFAKISSDGAPYSAFSLVAIVLMTFFQGVAGDVSNSLSLNAGMASKVYFPRLALPLAAMVSKLMDLMIMLVMLAVVLGLTGSQPRLVAVVAVPAALVVAGLTGLGLGLLLAGLAVQYRDVRFGQGFFLQLLFFASPVVYPLSSVPPQWRQLYELNPLASAIDTMRAALLGMSEVPWGHLAAGAVGGALLCVIGNWSFHRGERVLADVG